MDKQRIEKDINECAVLYSKNKNDPANKGLAENMKRHIIALYISRDNDYGRYLLKKAGNDFSKNKITARTADPDMVITDVLLNAIENYDHEKNPNFSAYFFTYYKYRIGDLKKEEIKHNKRTAAVTFSTTEKDEEIENDPLNDITTDDEEALHIKTDYPDKLINILSMSTKFYEHNKGKAANEKRRYYSGLFSTDRSVSVLKAFPDIADNINETEYFDSINLDFLDFFMSQECSDIKDIISCGLKKNSQLMDNCQESIRDQEAVQPLKPAVYRKYIYEDTGEQITDAAFSLQKKSFDELLKKILTI